MTLDRPLGHFDKQCKLVRGEFVFFRRNFRTFICKTKQKNEIELDVHRVYLCYPRCRLPNLHFGKKITK